MANQEQKAHFMWLLESLPEDLRSCFDIDKPSVDTETLKENYETLSSGEKIMLKFISQVYTGGGNFFEKLKEIDIVKDAGRLSENNWEKIATWWKDPYWI